MHKMFMGFIAAYFIASLVLFLVEPAVHSYGEGLWFCFVSFSTIGFGDYTSVTMIGRITIVVVTIYAIIVTAMVPGVVVSYYLEYLKVKENDTISTFLEKLENLSELSKEELDSTIRFSFSELNTEEEARYTVDTVSELLPMLRRFKR